MAKTQVVTPRTVDGGGQVFDFRCPYTAGCGDGEGTPFFSTGWADRDHAVARAEQHIQEHRTGEPMPALEDFRAERGLTPESAGSSSLPDDWEF